MLETWDVHAAVRPGWRCTAMTEPSSDAAAQQWVSVQTSDKSCIDKDRAELVGCDGRVEGVGGGSGKAVYTRARYVCFAAGLHCRDVLGFLKITH